MKKMNKKGFTIVELVIVIAVIGILATVLIPTFGDVISNANDESLRLGARNAFVEHTATTPADVTASFVYVDDGRYVAINAGKLVTTEEDGEEVIAIFDDPDAAIAAAGFENVADSDPETEGNQPITWELPENAKGLVVPTTAE